MDLRTEQRLFRKGFSHIAGLDEVGRGSLAGPVVAAGIFIDPHFRDRALVKLVRDSKRLSPAKRELIFEKIRSSGLTIATAAVTASTIDRIGIERATFRAMRRIIKRRSPIPDIALIDGNRAPNLPILARPIIKGDSRIFVVAAASIIAKVTRDRLMVRLNKRHPEYGFHQNKGYGTSAHQRAIRRHGVCPLHRTSFLKNIL